MKNLRILHLEDNDTDAELVREVLESEASFTCAIDRVSSKVGFEQALQRTSYEVILSDFSMPGFDGLTALALSQELKPSVPFLFLSGTIGEERAVEALRKGAVDYILKDRMQRLGPAILRARSEADDRLERNENELQIREQAELLNQAQDAIYVRNLAQTITYWNKAAERIYGWTAAEVVGKRASDLLYKAGGPSRDSIWKAVLELGEWSGELIQVTKGGKEICVSSRRTLLRDLNGNPRAILNINTDITEKKSLESQIIRSQRMDSIGTLAGGIAHDLNNVLAPILMVTELLRDRLTDSGDIRMLDVAKKSANRGTEMVKQILQFARGSKSQESALNFQSLVSDLKEFVSKTFPATIRVEASVQEGLLPVFGDATQIHQILLNLCVNARDAMPEGGKLSICLRNTILANHRMYGQAEPVTGSFVELSISDTGTGIPPEILSRIFEPFFTTKAENKGTGIGLSTVATIIRNHDGYLDVSSELGIGTMFRVFLRPSKSEPAKVAISTSAVNPSGQGEWILVVDDEFALLEMTKELLETYDYHVLTAGNGREALTCLAAHHKKIVAVITDLMMPELSGGELISNLSKRYPDTIRVCVSGSIDQNVSRFDRNTVHAFLHKPCSITDILGTLDKLLEPRRRNLESLR